MYRSFVLGAWSSDGIQGFGYGNIHFGPGLDVAVVFLVLPSMMKTALVNVQWHNSTL